MRQSTQIRQPIVFLLGALAAVVVALGASREIAAADVASPVEAETFDVKPTGTSVVTDTALYANSQALKFSNNKAVAKESVDFTSSGDVVLMARADQKGGSPKLRVSVSGTFTAPAQAIINSDAPKPYTFDVNAPSGSDVTIGVKAANTGSGRYPYVDTVTFPASGAGTDTTPPETTITSGPSGPVTGTTATFEFASNEPGSTFQCQLLPLEPASANCTSPKDYSGLTAGTGYTFTVWATDASGNADASPATRTFTPSGDDEGTDGDGDGIPDATDQCPTQPGPASNNGCPLPTATSEVLVGAGDISSGGTRDEETGDLVRAQLPPNDVAWGVFTTGDNAYLYGTYENYQVYDASWGSFRSSTRPTYGNHEYSRSSTAAGSEQYWNEGPDPTPVPVSNAASFYAYDVGNSNWRAIVLNSISTDGPSGQEAPSCADGSPQMAFLINELSTTKNTLLFWHNARFSAGSDHPTSEGATGCSKRFFDVAHDNGADLVLEGHSHLYERYDSRDKTGTQVAGGLTSIVCGTGGNSFDQLQALPSPTPDAAFTNAWGVCKLTLNTNNAQVDFLPAPGSPGKDSATVAVRP